MCHSDSNDGISLGKCVTMIQMCHYDNGSALGKCVAVKQITGLFRENLSKVE